jgi:hypothetical protein
VIVACHDDDRLLVAREVPEARQRQDVAGHPRDQIRQQPLLLVGLRDRHLAEIDPIGGTAAKEHIVRTDRRLAVALRAGPSWIALPGQRN